MTLLIREPHELVERTAPLLIRPLHEVKRKAVESAMILCGGNIRLAAMRLGISQTGLRKMLAEYRKADA